MHTYIYIYIYCGMCLLCNIIQLKNDKTYANVCGSVSGVIKANIHHRSMQIQKSERSFLLSFTFYIISIHFFIFFFFQHCTTEYINQIRCACVNIFKVKKQKKKRTQDLHINIKFYKKNFWNYMARKNRHAFYQRFDGLTTQQCNGYDFMQVSWTGGAEKYFRKNRNKK